MFPKLQTFYPQNGLIKVRIRSPCVICWVGAKLWVVKKLQKSFLPCVIQPKTFFCVSVSTFVYFTTSGKFSIGSYIACSHEKLWLRLEEMPTAFRWATWIFWIKYGFFKFRFPIIFHKYLCTVRRFEFLV